MSDDEHHFESKADAGASKTFPQQAGTIRKNAYIVIKQRPCKVTDSQGIFFPQFGFMFNIIRAGALFTPFFSSSFFGCLWLRE